MRPLPPDQVSPFETRAPSRRVKSRPTSPKESIYGPGSARGPPVGATERPPYVAVKQACALGGFGRSKLYELLGLGLVRAVKLGTKTLIDTSTLLAYLESLPAAQIRPLKPVRKLACPSTGARSIPQNPADQGREPEPAPTGRAFLTARAPPAARPRHDRPAADRDADRKA